MESKRFWGARIATNAHEKGTVMSAPVELRDSLGRTRLIRPSSDHTLAQAMFLAGVWPRRAYCAGLGRCGLCAVRYVADASDPLPEEQDALSKANLELGWRLACRRPALPGLRIELPFAFPQAASSHEGLSLKGPFLERAADKELCLAVDLGTTSVHWQLADTSGMLAQGEELNPQLAAGSEVMSRLGFALGHPDNARMLRDVIIQWLEPLVTAAQVERMCVAGNSVMTALLLGWPLEGLATAPYNLPGSGGIWTRLAAHWPQTYIPPLPAPFIGADVSAGLAHIHFNLQPAPVYPYVLADMGTNGEFVLVLGPEDCLAASVPLGPALEGIGMRHGAAAQPGVWVDFHLKAGKIAPVPLPGDSVLEPDAEPRISGTGYLRLLALLHNVGLVDDRGRFTFGRDPLSRRLGQALEENASGRRFILAENIALTGRDVEELLKVKAAFNLAFSRLLAEAGLTASDVQTVYLAGALGAHVRLETLEDLGFVPLGMKNRMRALGNTSLAGAALLARSAKAREWLETLSPRIRTLLLGQERDFFTQYIQRLVLTYVP